MEYCGLLTRPTQVQKEPHTCVCCAQAVCHPFHSDREWRACALFPPVCTTHTRSLSPHSCAVPHTALLSSCRLPSSHFENQSSCLYASVPIILILLNNDLKVQSGCLWFPGESPEPLHFCYVILSAWHQS